MREVPCEASHDHSKDQEVQCDEAETGDQPLEQESAERESESRLAETNE